MISHDPHCYYGLPNNAMISVSPLSFKKKKKKEAEIQDQDFSPKLPS